METLADAYRRATRAVRAAPLGAAARFEVLYPTITLSIKPCISGQGFRV